MNVEILSPSPLAKKRKSRLTVDHVMPGDVITAEPGFMRYILNRKNKKKKRKKSKTNYLCKIQGTWDVC